jgi:hypothetical protein
MSDIDLGVYSRVVPDGVNLNADGSIASYRFSVVFMPYPGKVAGDVTFDAQNWPAQIAQIAGDQPNRLKLRIFIARDGTNPAIGAAVQNPRAVAVQNISVWPDRTAAEWWNKILKLPIPTSGLAAATAPTVGRALKSAFKGKYVRPRVNWPVIAWDTSSLTAFARATRAAEMISQLATLPQPGAKANGAAASGQLLYGSVQRRLANSGKFVTLHGASRTRSLLARKRNAKPLAGAADAAGPTPADYPVRVFAKQLAIGIGNSHRRRNKPTRQDDAWSNHADDHVDKDFYAALTTSLQHAKDNKEHLTTALLNLHDRRADYFESAESADADKAKDAKEQLTTARVELQKAQSPAAVAGNAIKPLVEFLLAPSPLKDSIDAFGNVGSIHALYRAAMSVDYQPPPLVHIEDAAPPPDPDEAAKAIARKLQGLYSYPTLAKYFGLIIDVTVPKQDFEAWERSASVKNVGDTAYGYIAVDLGQSGQMSWTAYKRRSATLDGYTSAFHLGHSQAAMTPRHPFQPCTEDESNDAIQKGTVQDANQYSQFFGLQNLGESFSGAADGRRFALETIDVHSATNDREGTIRDGQNRDDGGEIAGSSDRGFGDTRSAGIAIVDRARGGNAQTGVTKQQLQLSPITVGSINHSFLDTVADLTVGQRIDVAVQPASGTTSKTPDRWFGLNERVTTFPDVLANPAAKGNYYPMRDRGFVRPADRVMKVSPPQAQFKGTVANLTNQMAFDIGDGNNIIIDDGSIKATATQKAGSKLSMQSIFDAVAQANNIKIKASLDAGGYIELSATDTNFIKIDGTAPPAKLAQFGLAAGMTMPPGAYIGDPTKDGPLPVQSGHMITVDDESPKATVTSTGSITVKQIIDAVTTVDEIKVKVSLASGQLKFEAPDGKSCISIAGNADPSQLRNFGLTFGTHQPPPYVTGSGLTLTSAITVDAGKFITIGSNAVIVSTGSLTAQQIVDGVNNAAGLDVTATLDADKRIELHSLNASTIVIGGTAIASELSQFGLTATTANSGSNAIVAYDAIATWRNWSLSVPSAECDMTLQPDYGTDLPISVTYKLPTKADADQDDSVLMPPLRYDRSYLFGARPVFANGSSLWSTEAHWLYGQYQRFILGQPGASGDPDTAYQFMRQEPIAKPDVHLAAGLEKLPAPRDSTNDGPYVDRCLGESITRLVVRTSRDGQPVYGASTSRWIVPPRLPFEAVEIEGKFDDAARRGQPMPHGAFRSFILCPKTGSFPPSVDGQVRLDLCIAPPPPSCPPDPPVKPPKPPKVTGSDTIALFRAGHPGLPTPSGDLQSRYYPDPRAKFVWASIQLKDPSIEPITVKIPIYPNDLKWPDAVPLRIDLVRMSETAEKRGQRCVVTGPQLHVGLGSFQLLTIALARGEDVKLDVWCTDDVESTLANNPGVRDMLDVLGLSPLSLGKPLSPAKPLPPSDLWDPVRKIFTPEKGLTNDDLETLLLASAPMPAITRKLHVQLAHAVEAPLAAPEQDSGNTLGVVRFNGADQNAWQDYVHQNAGDPTKWIDKAPGATKAFFFGKVQLDRATTGQLTAFGRWLAWDDDKIIIKDGVDTYKQIAARPARVKLFDPLNIPNASAGGFDLLLGDGNAALGTHYDFGDTKSRTVTMQLQAYTRFASNFPKSDRYIIRSSTREITIQIPSTARPQAPVVDRILPAFVWKKEHGTGDNGTRYVTTSRHSRIRIFLNRPWYSSGENELLAVVCWPPYLFGLNGATPPACYSNNIPSIPLTEIDDATTYGQIERWVTRWGADPTKRSEDTLQNWIPADYLQGWKQSGVMLDLPIPASNTGGASGSSGSGPSCMGKVAVAGYEPKFDGLENRWICDVHLEGGGYFPFVRLGLARWQPNSLLGYELSSPVAEWIQIPPRRDARANVSANGSVEVRVSGPRYYEAKTQVTGTDVARANQPLVVFRLMEAPATAGGALIPVAEFPEQERELAPDPDHPDQWHGNFLLPKNSRGRHFAIFIEEYELLAADDVAGLARRGPTFACKLDLPETA